MSRIKGSGPSAALIVAVVALVAALGGGAVAGVTISKLNKKEGSTPWNPGAPMNEP